MSTPKTIQIFLPNGEPQGIRIAELTTRIVQVIEVPRSLLQNFLSMPESNQVALYFLFGRSEDDTESSVYIGQSGDLRVRMNSHNRSEKEWERALVLISKTNSLTQTHSLYLEWHSIQIARKAARYICENGNAGSKPHTPAPLEADCMEIFETGQVLLATLGYPIFEDLSKSSGASQREEVFVCKGPSTEGRGLYTPEGFVVLKGSLGRKETAKSYGESNLRHRERLKASGVIQEEGDQIKFSKDHPFGSPSTAAMALLGRTANGWVEWKTKEGKTLDAVKRPAVV